MNCAFCNSTPLEKDLTGLSRRPERNLNALTIEMLNKRVTHDSSAASVAADRSSGVGVPAAKGLAHHGDDGGDHRRVSSLLREK